MELFLFIYWKNATNYKHTYAHAYMQMHTYTPMDAHTDSKATVTIEGSYFMSLRHSDGSIVSF